MFLRIILTQTEEQTGCWSWKCKKKKTHIWANKLRSNGSSCFWWFNSQCWSFLLCHESKIIIHSSPYRQTFQSITRRNKANIGAESTQVTPAGRIWCLAPGDSTINITENRMFTSQLLPDLAQRCLHFKWGRGGRREAALKAVALHVNVHRFCSEAQNSLCRTSGVRCLAFFPPGVEPTPWHWPQLLPVITTQTADFLRWLHAVSKNNQQTRWTNWFNCSGRFSL